jgi:uncharacterized protein YodC (DUF2158 family)
MSSTQFKAGDVVVLKSGGPKMTVMEVRSDGLLCRWFAGNESKIDVFEPVTVIAVTGPQI